MSRQVAPRRARVSRRQHLERERRRRRLALFTVAALVVGVVVLLSAFGGSGQATQAPPVSPATRLLLPAGPPSPQVIATFGKLQLKEPISQSRVTAIGYQGGSEGAVALHPAGTERNEGLLKRLLHSVVGVSSAKPRWFQLPGGIGPSTSALEIGAAAGTDVYSPVDGSIVGITDLVLNGRPYGSSIDIQSSEEPSLVVTISHVRVDPSLAVGSAVSASTSKLGAIIDFSRVEKQALARYTNDTGNHVDVEVHASATLQVS
jgi:hypothetical protein